MYDNWLFLNLFSYLLKIEGRIKEEWSSKTSFKPFISCCYLWWRFYHGFICYIYFTTFFMWAFSETYHLPERPIRSNYCRTYQSLRNWWAKVFVLFHCLFILAAALWSQSGAVSDIEEIKKGWGIGCFSVF